MKNFLEHEKKRALDFKVAFTKIKKILSSISQKRLRYYLNEVFIEQLSVNLAEIIVNLDQQDQSYPSIEKLIFHDFRLVGDYLRILNANSEFNVYIENIDKFISNYSMIAFNRCKSSHNATCQRVRFVDELELIFDSSSLNDLILFCPNAEDKKNIMKLIDKTKGFLGSYIDSQLDLEGINASVRKGLVKKIEIFNKTFITKKNNPNKQGRFKTEVFNFKNLASYLGLDHQNSTVISQVDSLKKPVLKMLSLHSVCYDASNQSFYFITSYLPHPTLEEILLTTPNLEKRAMYFKHIRSILDYLYEKGIIWGDMAPRNILVNEENQHVEYTILDFEKTKILDSTIPYNARMEHARGPMCVEEFGAICTREEVEKIFYGYFEPVKWDLNTREAIPFLTPKKREIDEILFSRGESDYTFGEYNKLELEVMEVRFPHVNIQKILYPVWTSFKIDHYLGNEWDRKTTELLIKARKYGVLTETLLLLNSIIECLENSFIIQDLKRSFLGSNDLMTFETKTAIKLLQELINCLYLEKNKNNFNELISKFNKESFFFVNTLLSNPYRPLIMRNYVYLEHYAIPLLEKISQSYKADLLMVSGSFCRKEITYASDIEVFIFSNNFHEIEFFLQENFNKKFGVDVDSYAVTKLLGIESFLTALPDYFIDFKNARKLSGEEKNLAIFRKEVDQVFSKPGFIRKVLEKRVVSNAEKKMGSHEKIKEMLNMWSTLEAIADYLNFKCRLSEAKQIKQTLLYYKNKLEFNTYYGIESENIDSYFLTNLTLLLNETKRVISDFLPYNVDLQQENYHLNINAHELKKVQEIDFNLLKSFRWMKANSALAGQVDDKKLLMNSIKPLGPLVRVAKAALFSIPNEQVIIDLSSMTLNCVLGQNDPWVKLNQAAYILSDRPSFHSSRLGSELYYEIPRLLTIAKIGGIIDPQINHRQSNGSDVVELAIKAAYEKKSDRKYLISFKGSYHGQNLTAYIASDLQKQHRFFDSFNNDVVFLDAPPNKRVWTVSQVLENRSLSSEEEKIITQLERLAKDSYAIILEPVQVNNKLNMFSLPLMQKIKEIAIENKICLIFDEIQTGFGWLGKMTAAELYGVSPDILLLSKALTSGNGPLAIAIFSGVYKDSLPYGTSEKTNGADLRSLVAVKAVFERLNGVTDQSEIPKSFNEELQVELRTNLMCDHRDFIVTKLGIGFIRGLQIKPIGTLSAEEVTKRIVEESLSNGVFLRNTGDILIIKPPLVISENELFIAFNRLSQTLHRLRDSLYEAENDSLNKPAQEGPRSVSYRYL